MKGLIRLTNNNHTKYMIPYTYNVGYIIAYIEPGGLVDRDGRFAIGDEIVNVNGQSLRGLEMEVARNVLRKISGTVDVIIARAPDSSDSSNGILPRKGPVKKRRRLPVLERPKSAPLTGETIDKSSEDNSVMDVCDFSSGRAAMKTVIKVSDAASPIKSRNSVSPADKSRNSVSPSPEMSKVTATVPPEMASKKRLTNSMSSVSVLKSSKKNSQRKCYQLLKLCFLPRCPNALEGPVPLIILGEIKLNEAS